MFNCLKVDKVKRMHSMIIVYTPGTHKHGILLFSDWSETSLKYST